MPKEIVTCTRPKYLSWPAVQSSNILLWGQSGYASQTLDSRSKGRKNKKTAPKDMFLLHANMFDRILTMWQIIPPPPIWKKSSNLVFGPLNTLLSLYRAVQTKNYAPIQSSLKMHLGSGLGCNCFSVGSLWSDGNQCYNEQWAATGTKLFSTKHYSTLSMYNFAIHTHITMPKQFNINWKDFNIMFITASVECQFFAWNSRLSAMCGSMAAGPAVCLNKQPPLTVEVTS